MCVECRKSAVRMSAYLCETVQQSKIRSLDAWAPVLLLLPFKTCLACVNLSQTPRRGDGVRYRVDDRRAVMKRQRACRGQVQEGPAHVGWRVEVWVEGVFLHSQRQDRTKRLTRRGNNYELKKRLNKAALRNRLTAQVCSTGGRGGQDK